MKQIHLHCEDIRSPRQLHERLRDALGFPDWYGCNLDALHDCLTALPEETELVLTGFSWLPPFFRGFLRVMEDAQEENPAFHMILM